MKPKIGIELCNSNIDDKILRNILTTVVSKNKVAAGAVVKKNTNGPLGVAAGAVAQKNSSVYS